jgi:aldose 1-epimerase
VVQDVVLGYDTPQEYLDQDGFFGAVVGRSGNRIDKGRFEIGGKTYQMAINDNENNLHSGLHYYHTRKWEVTEADETANRVTFALVSPDGDQGYPGNFHLTVSYTLTEDNEVVLHYHGVSDQDTVANLTNHSYFNLAGHASGDVEDQIMQLFADGYTPVRDSQAIPTGEIAPVEGTPMDLRSPKTIGPDIRAAFEQRQLLGGYDHNFVLGEAGVTKKFAEVYAPKTGICMEGITDCCGVQFYAGNMISERRGKKGASYAKRQGFCLETQYYPNSVNEKNFPSPIVRAGEPYDTTTVYRFSVRNK